MSEAPRRRKRWKIVLFMLLAVIGLAGGAAFSQRTALRAWYYAYQLERAPEGERQAWADQLIDMGEPALPRLLGLMRKDDAPVCAIARTSLEKLLKSWGPDDPRAAKLVDKFFEAHPTFSPAGQMAALQLLPDLLDVRLGGVEAAAKARTIVTAALKDRSPEQRWLAIAVAMRDDLNLLPLVVPLLNDPEATVRQKAMMVLGPVREGASGVEQPLVSSDELLHWLHDPDPEVRRWCERSLRTREVGERDIELGRMLTDPDPMGRLQLLLALPSEEELSNMTKWLRKLSEDPDSAVRAAAARVAAERQIDFADRLDQMTHSDPDGTVRKIAEHYRKQYR